MHNWIGRHFLTPLSPDATGQVHGDTPRVPVPLGGPPVPFAPQPCPNPQ